MRKQGAEDENNTAVLVVGSSWRCAVVPFAAPTSPPHQTLSGSGRLVLTPSAVAQQDTQRPEPSTPNQSPEPDPRASRHPKPSTQQPTIPTLDTQHPKLRTQHPELQAQDPQPQIPTPQTSNTLDGCFSMASGSLASQD